MFMNRRSLAVVGLVLGAFAGSVLAAEVHQTLDVGGQTKSVDVPAAKFEEYRDVPKNAMINRYTLDASDEKGRLNLDARDLLREDRRITLKGDYRRKVVVDLLWDQTPHRFGSGEISKTLYSQPQPGVFTLDPALTTKNQGLMDNFNKKYSTAAYVNSLNDALLNATPAELKFRNDTGRVGVKVNPTDAVTVKVGAGQTARTGTKSLGASLGFSGAIELPAPVDDVTRDASVGLEYATRKFQAQAGYTWSQYDNNIPSLTWDNPKRATDQTYSGAYSNADGTARGRIPTAPDSLNQRVNATVGVSDLPWHGRVTASVSYARATQTTTLLPYTINSAIKTASPGIASLRADDPANLPAQVFNARIDTLVQRYAVNLRPVDPVSVQVAYRDQKQENKSDKITFPGAVWLDETWTAGTFENNHFGFTKRDLDGDVKVRVVKPLTLGVGAGYNWTDRNQREVDKTTEKSLRGSADWNPLRWASVSGSVLAARRRMDDFDNVHYRIDEDATKGFGELPGLRRFDVADRDRLQSRAGVNLPLTDKLNLGLSGLLGQDDFLPGAGDLTGGLTTNTNQQYGFLSDKYRSATVTADYAPVEKLTLSAMADVGRNESQERSNTSGHSAPVTQDAPNDWTASMTDDYITGGGGVTVKPLEALGLRADYTYTRSKGQIALTDIAATTLVEQSPPDSITFRHTGKVRADYRLNKTFSIGAAYLYENYDVTDWATNNIPRVPGKTSTGAPNPNGLWLGNRSVSYVAHVIGGNVQARF